MSVRTPVAFIIFNRPDLTQRVFAEIAKAQPSELLVIADGPRNKDERQACDAARHVVSKVDWPCQVKLLFSETNLGCKRRVSSGLDWVFENVSEAIILEDDCLPHPDFFRFCDALINQYRDDECIGHIGGTDYNQGPPRGTGSYYFSRYTSIWGWATWKRAWQHYDVSMRDWPEVRRTKAHYGMFGTAAEARHLESAWDDIYNGEINTWDGQWLFACRQRGLLSIAPNGNLISNLGCRADATHTTANAHPFAELPFGKCQSPLRHPLEFAPDDEADERRAGAEFIRGQSVLRRLASRLSNRHFYGKAIRGIPGIGALWATYRESKS